MGSDQAKISLEADGDSFVLRLMDNGKIIQVRLARDNVLILGQSAISFRQPIMASRRPGTVYATPVEDIALEWDALEEEVLMKVSCQPSGNVTLGFSPDQIEQMIEKLTEILYQPLSTNLTRQ